MLRIHEGDLTAPLLCLSQNVQGKGGFTGGFRAVDFNDSALGHTTDSQGRIQGQGAGRDCLHVHFRPVTQAHHGSLAEILIDLGQGGLQCFFLIRGRSGRFIGGLFRSHS